MKRIVRLKKPEEINEFYNLLYTSNTKNALRLSYNYLMSSDPNEINDYFNRMMHENVKIVKTEEKKLLNLRAYEILNYSLEQINNMSAEQIEKINHQVYDYFKIRENAINKEYLLDEAVKAFDREKNKLTTGNGYVDVLLIMSIVTTLLFVVGMILYRVL